MMQKQLKQQISAILFSIANFRAVKPKVSEKKETIWYKASGEIFHLNSKFFTLIWIV